MGRATAGSRSQSGTRAPRCPPSPPGSARPALPGPRHPSFPAWLPSLRGDAVCAAVRAALAASSTATFRVVHWSIQSDHVHLLVEADGHVRLIRGLQGLAVRVARAANRALRSRGCVWADRYQVRRLSTPREVRHALVYVLQNWRKHVPGARGLDPRSSAAWFRGLARSDGMLADEGAGGATADVARGGGVAVPRPGRSRRNPGARAGESSSQGRAASYQRVARQVMSGVDCSAPTPSPRVPSSLPPRAQTK